MDDLGHKHNTQLVSAFFQPQIYFTSNNPSTITKIHQKGTPALICSSDRPVILYIEHDKVELQYIAVNYVELRMI